VEGRDTPLPRRHLEPLAQAQEPAEGEGSHRTGRHRGALGGIKAYFQHTEGARSIAGWNPTGAANWNTSSLSPRTTRRTRRNGKATSWRLQSRHPPFEIVFVWDAKDGRLELHLTGDRKAVEPMQAIFAETILKCAELPTDPADSRVYNLFPLRRKEFSFTWDPASGIERVAVNKLRLSLNKDKKLTLEANPKHDAKAVYALLEKLRPRCRAMNIRSARSASRPG
jgi:hypothetical protein